MGDIKVEGRGRNTAFEYRYADASNNKVYGTVVLSGAMTQEQLDRMMENLHESEFFIPLQVGLRDLQGDFEYGHGWEEQDDHPFHTIWGVVLTDKEADGPTVDELVSRWPAADGWDSAKATRELEQRLAP